MSETTLIDTTDIMYGTFQSCRHALHHTGTALNLLAETLEMVKQQGMFVVEDSDEWVNKNNLQRLVVSPGDNTKQDNSLSPASERLFSLLYIGAQELQRLWALEAKQAVRCLGYSFHFIPAILRTPEEFSPEGYMTCFRLIAYHWDQLSVEMRQAYCKILDLEFEVATKLATSPGYSFEGWRTPSQNMSNAIPDSLQKLIDSLTQLPRAGPRMAR